MNSRAIWGTVFAAVFVLSMLMPSAFAGGHLALSSASADITGERLKADITAQISIPLDGSAGAFGYAVLTDGGSGALDNVLVLVTHLGIDDSEHEDPVSGFHTHVLDLMAPSNKCKKHTLEVDLGGSVANSAFDPDYHFNISGNDINLRNIPTADLGDPSEVIGVASFTVTPVFKGGNLSNLCIDVIQLV